MANSLLYATTGSALAVLLALVPAFALQPFRAAGKRLVFGLLVIGMMLPQQTVLIPLYDLLRSCTCSTHKIGLIIVHGAYGMPGQILDIARLHDHNSASNWRRPPRSRAQPTFRFSGK